MNTSMWIAAVNLLVCLGIVVAVAWRLNVVTRETKPHIRAQFVLLLVGALASGGSPALWGELPGIGALMLSCAVLAYLVIGMHRWLHSAPAGTGSDWMGLSSPGDDTHMEIHHS